MFLVHYDIYCFLSQEEINVCRTEFRIQLPLSLASFI